MRRKTGWEVLEDEVIMVKTFSPLARVEHGKVSPTRLGMLPYALVTVVSPKLPTEEVLPVLHRLDFLHLWQAFNVRTVAEDEEVLIHWSRKYDRWIFNFFSSLLPRLHIMICPRGAYSKMTDPNWWKQAHGEEGFHSIRPIHEWRPI